MKLVPYSTDGIGEPSGDPIPIMLICTPAFAASAAIPTAFPS